MGKSVPRRLQQPGAGVDVVGRSRGVNLTARLAELGETPTQALTPPRSERPSLFAPQPVGGARSRATSSAMGSGIARARRVPSRSTRPWVALGVVIAPPPRRGRAVAARRAAPGSPRAGGPSAALAPLQARVSNNSRAQPRVAGTC